MSIRQPVEVARAPGTYAPAARLAFQAGKDVASLKTTKGYHDLSPMQLNPKAEISSQQSKGRADIPSEQVHVFMPLSYELDQAVFQNINTLAKAHGEQRAAFCDRVRQIRSEMPRLKLAAEHDMAVAFPREGRRENCVAPPCALR